nr:zinc finger, CCHC-type [Tanacetum cinerariifolium]
MHFLLSSMSVVYVLTTPILEDGENATIEQIRKRNKWDNDDHVCRCLILNGVTQAHDSDKPKGNNVDGPSVVNMVEHNNSFRMMKLRGGLTQKQLCMCVKIDVVTRISTIRLLIGMTSIHNMIIHQMDVKITFLNGELDEEIYMNQPQGFIMPDNESKVDLIKEFLSLKFSMKDIGEANVILDIRIKHESNGIVKTDTQEKDKVIRSQKVKSQSPRSTKVNPGKVKVNPEKVKVKPGKAEAEKSKENTI